MAFELSPDIEQSIRLAAAREGMAIEELLRRTFAPASTLTATRPPQEDTEKSPSLSDI